MTMPAIRLYPLSSRCGVDFAEACTAIEAAGIAGFQVDGVGWCIKTADAPRVTQLLNVSAAKSRENALTTELAKLAPDNDPLALMKAVHALGGHRMVF